jgi:NAD(P)-dependent dehydrogenase (short-subunit alcohol dehydrogenase family)
VVTGGSRGIGPAIVELFVEHGASVVFCGRKEAAGLAVEREIGAGGQAVFEAADVSQEADVARLIESCTKRFGPRRFW